MNLIDKFIKKKINFLDLNDKIIIRCRTEREAKELLDIAYQNGYKWANQKMVSYWYQYQDKTCYIFYLDKIIQYTTVDFFSSITKIYEFREVIFV